MKAFSDAAHSYSLTDVDPTIKEGKEEITSTNKRPSLIDLGIFAKRTVACLMNLTVTIIPILIDCFKIEKFFYALLNKDSKGELFNMYVFKINNDS